jgi:hypothetical protein
MSFLTSSTEWPEAAALVAIWSKMAAARSAWPDCTRLARTSPTSLNASFDRAISLEFRPPSALRIEETQSGWKIVPYDVKSYGLFYRIWDFIGIIFYWIYYPIKVKIFGVDKLIKELEQKSTK